MLAGVKVLSFTHFLQGPSTTQILADLGADVVKVESPKGAFERTWSGPDAYLNEVSVFFMLANRNVRSIAVDMKNPQAREVLDGLVRSADVLIENFRPGAMERLGLGWERVHELNPRLVYASLSGYGSDGPYRDRPGQDVLVQAISGLAQATGGADAPPTPVGASIVDQHGAVLGALGILAALHGRAATGEGVRVESNLLNAALDLQIEPLAYHLNGLKGERSPSNISSPFYKAPYGVFETADGHLCISLTAPNVLAEVFEDPWFATVTPDQEVAQREAINTRVALNMKSRTVQEWEDHFARHSIWYAPVNGYEDVIKDPQVLHNDSFLSFDHPQAGHVRVLGHPITYNGKRPGLRLMPPTLAADTRDVLNEAGFDDATVDRLVAAGAITEKKEEAADVH